MMIKVLPNNNRVIAYGSYRGKRIKAIAVCNEDSFDKDFGVELAKKKYGVAKCKVKIDMHKKNISALKDMIKWCENMIDAENRSMDMVKTNLAIKESELTDFVESKFKD